MTDLLLDNFCYYAYFCFYYMLWLEVVDVALGLVDTELVVCSRTVAQYQCSLYDIEYIIIIISSSSSIGNRTLRT